MKKNLRIVSAAAAALLAVAPVAASVVPAASTVVSAATDYNDQLDNLNTTGDLGTIKRFIKRTQKNRYPTFPKQSNDFYGNDLSN